MIVTLAEAKTYLNQANQADDDALITSLIAQAEGICEAYTRKRFALAERVDIVNGGNEALLLRYIPLGVLSEETSEVTEILDLDNSGAEVDLDLIDVDAEAGLVYLLSEAAWGAGRRRWQVTYGGGYDGAPDAVKQAALIIIADLYENRNAATGTLGDRSVTASMDGIPTAARVILDRYKEPAI